MPNRTKLTNKQNPPNETYRSIKMAPQPLHLPKSLFTITEENVPVMSSCQQQRQREKEESFVPLDDDDRSDNVALQLSTSFSSSFSSLSSSSSSLSSSSTSTSTSTSRRNCTSSTSLKRNLHLLSDVLEILDRNPQDPTRTTRAATKREEKFDGTFARWEGWSEGDPPPTRPLRRLSPAA